uniref:SGNH domain-containing protein n=1 Tax=Bursaphelenchus xylophilus TaxID=6326 RepID=A0A1I7RQB2_BURXY
MAKYAQKTPFCGEKCLKHCFDYERQILNILKEWPTPIDIIIVQHSYGEFKKLPYNPNDEPQQIIQNFYSQLESVAREAVILPYAEVWAPSEFTVYMKRLAFLNGVISSSEKWERNGTAIINKRIEDIKCRKCIKIDYSKLICHKNGRCNFSSPTGTLYYVDHLHTTMYHSLTYAERIRQRYDEFLMNNE